MQYVIKKDVEIDEKQHMNFGRRLVTKLVVGQIYFEYYSANAGWVLNPFLAKKFSSRQEAEEVLKTLGKGSIMEI